MPRKVKMPADADWLKFVADDSLLNCKDVRDLFRYSSSESLCNASSDGRFPKPDFIKADFGPRGKFFWKASTIRREIARRKAIHNGE